MSYYHTDSYRLEDIRKIKYNGLNLTVFKAYVKRGESFVYCGQYSAPARTAKKNLWNLSRNEFAY